MIATTSRNKSGLGPIRVQLVYNSNSSLTERLLLGSDNLLEDKENTNVNVVSRHKKREKKKRAEEVRTRLEP